MFKRMLYSTCTQLKVSVKYTNEKKKTLKNTFSEGNSGRCHSPPPAPCNAPLLVPFHVLTAISCVREQFTPSGASLYFSLSAPDICGI